MVFKIYQSKNIHILIVPNEIENLMKFCNLSLVFFQFTWASKRTTFFYMKLKLSAPKKKHRY
jgi:hypothetical protein